MFQNNVTLLLLKSNLTITKSIYQSLFQNKCNIVTFQIIFEQLPNQFICQCFKIYLCVLNISFRLDLYYKACWIHITTRFGSFLNILLWTKLLG